MNSYTPQTTALRTLRRRLIATLPEFSLELARHPSALSVAYPARQGHPLNRRRGPVPALDSTGLVTLLRPDSVASGPLERIRPDGHAAWASDEPDDGTLDKEARETLAAAHR
ncbi:hypothetical protein [Streptomyces sp. NPDC003710]